MFKVGDKVKIVKGTSRGSKRFDGLVTEIVKGPFLEIGKDHRYYEVNKPYQFSVWEEEIKLFKEEEEMAEIKNDSRALFSIIAIDLESDEIVYENKVIAEGEKEALFESDLKEKLKLKKLTRDDVHLIVKEIGSVPSRIRPRKFRVLGTVGKHSLMKEEV
jgi:hypothetical protein